MKTAEQPLIEFKQVSKVYGNFFANKDISFSVQRGSIHGIIGENGAGKSTSMKLLYGMEIPSAGEIFIAGKNVHFESPRQAKEHGIGMVHQHFMLAPSLTGLENLLLSQKGNAFSFLNKKASAIFFENLAQQYKFDVDLHKPVKNLSVGEQQRIEILKILSHQADILIFDEPTAVLGPSEVEKFFENLKKLKDSGKTILIITHKLKEILSLTDAVTVFRQGKSVFSGPTQNQSVETLVQYMMGHSVSFENNSAPTPEESKPILSIANFSHGFLKQISIEVHAGEIIGIAGVEGNGQQELIDFLTSPHGNFSGSALLGGQNLANFSTQQLRKMGMKIFPEDRLRKGCLPQRPATENILLNFSKSKFFRKSIFINFKKLRSTTQELFQKFSIQPLQVDKPFAEFSGGNQQKIVVARELFTDSSILLAAHPTRGVDIGSSAFIHNQILNQKKNNVAVLLISSDLDELMKLSDRILVFYQGRISGSFLRSEFDELSIGKAMVGQSL